MSEQSRTFAEEVAQNIAAQAEDDQLRQRSRDWMVDTIRHKYSYNFSWLGRPIIQYPQDIVAMQELLWKVQPDLIIETGIAHGGSLIFSASMLELNAICGGPADAELIGIDIDIREHNRVAIEAHPMARRIRMIQGSSVDPAIVRQVADVVRHKKSVMVCLDSNHTHEHVLAELCAYAPFVTPESYCVVFDTVVEDLPAALYPDRPWGPGNSPKSAVRVFLEANPQFEIEQAIQQKLLVTVAPDGFLKRVR
jgi:cephalosporin hydroxylase